MTLSYARTQENSNPDRPVYLMADAANLLANGHNEYLVPCDGFDWCFVEVDSNKQYGIYGIGQSGYGAQSYYFLVNAAGSVASRLGISGGSGYGMVIPCRNLAWAGCRVTNQDAVNDATITVRITLANG